MASFDSETFEEKEEMQDPLVGQMERYVDSMRTMSLTTNTTDPNSVKAALNNIMVMRVYHQITRIIKFTEQMDKIEAKLYTSIDRSLDSMSDSDPRTWITLLNIQERLQKVMIDSHKLLEPYLNLQELTYVEVTAEDSSDSFAKTLLDQDSRERLRAGAKAALAALDSTESLTKEKVVDDNE